MVDTDADDLVTKKVDVTVLPSMAADRAQMKGEDDMNVDVPINDDDEAAGILVYTGTTETVGVSNAFKSGAGTGEIVGYAVVLPSGSPMFSVVDNYVDADAMRDNTLDADASGMIKLQPLAAAVDAVAGVDITVTAHCPMADGTDATAACQDSSSAVVMATVAVAIGQSVGATKTNDSIPPQTMAVGETKTFSLHTVLKNVSFFADGKGTGVITGYGAESKGGNIVFARADNDGTVTLTAFAVGGTTMTCPP